MMDPRTLKKWLIAIGLVYLVLPRDLIPDFLGRGLGLIDDASLVALLTYLYRKRLRRDAGPATPGSGEGDPRKRGSRPRAKASPTAPDPFAILQIDASATGEQIEAAYKARMREYHPDKVAHLGEELQELAHRKTLEIQQAYERLRK